MTISKDKLYTIAPVTSDSSPSVKPEFIRLPKSGMNCPYTGLSRSKMYELLLPSDLNHHNPPVKSVCLRERGHLRGVRLIHYDSLLEYLYGKMNEQTKENNANHNPTQEGKETQGRGISLNTSTFFRHYIVQ